MIWERSGPGMIAIMLLLVTGLVAAGLLARTAAIAGARLDRAEAQMAQMAERVAAAEKAARDARAAQADLSAQLEEHRLALDGLEKAALGLRERLDALEEALRQHQQQHRGAQLGEGTLLGS